MLYHILITPLLLGLIIAAWLGFQSWVRKRSPGMRPDADVLRGRFSCGTCFEFESCHTTLTSIGDEATDRSPRLERLAKRAKISRRRRYPGSRPNT